MDGYIDIYNTRELVEIELSFFFEREDFGFHNDFHIIKKKALFYLLCVYEKVCITQQTVFNHIVTVRVDETSRSVSWS